MSYDVKLCDSVSGDVLEVSSPHYMRGGTYCVNGTTELWLNITYNYGNIFRKVMRDGIKGLQGKTAAETLPILKSAIEKLKNDVSDDYWEATEGNAKKALTQLYAMAQMRPDGVWDVN